MQEPLISIIIPVYNVEKYLERCVESVLRQTFAQIEIFLINDGSVDESPAICDRYAGRDKRISVIHQQNSGGCVAMQRGTELARAEYVMFLDGDDALHEDCCFYAYRAVEKHNPDIVFWPFMNVFENNTTKSFTPFREDLVFSGDALHTMQRRFFGLYGSELRNTMSTDAFSAAWGKLYRRDLFKKVPDAIIDFQKNHLFDTVINAKLFVHAQKASYVHRHLNLYNRINQNSTTKSHGAKLKTRFGLMFQQLEGVIESNQLSNDFFSALNNRRALSTINIGLSLAASQTFSTAYQTIAEVLRDRAYQSAYRQLEYKFLPLRFWIYLKACRYRMILFVVIMSFAMQKVRTKISRS